MYKYHVSVPLEGVSSVQDAQESISQFFDLSQKAIEFHVSCAKEEDNKFKDIEIQYYKQDQDFYDSIKESYRISDSDSQKHFDFVLDESNHPIFKYDYDKSDDYNKGVCIQFIFDRIRQAGLHCYNLERKEIISGIKALKNDMPISEEEIDKSIAHWKVVRDRWLNGAKHMKVDVVKK